MPSYIAHITCVNGENEYDWPIFIDAPDRLTAARLAEDEARTFWSADGADEDDDPETDGSGRYDWVYEGVATRFREDSTSLVEITSLDDVRRALYSVRAEDAVTA